MKVPKADKTPEKLTMEVSKADKTLEKLNVEVPKAEERSTRGADPQQAASSAKEQTEGQQESPKGSSVDNKSSVGSPETSEGSNKTLGGILLCRHNSAKSEGVDEGDPAADRSPKKKKKNKRRSVRFGTVVTDDGSPPVILGSDCDSNEDERADAEVKTKEDGLVSAPLFQRLGLLQRRGDETQKEERLKHLEFQKKQKEEEREQTRHEVEEEKKCDEDEREKEWMKQKEEFRLRDEQIERQRLQELERAREEEREQEKIREEAIEKERQMKLLQQKQTEEQRRREEKLKEERERERLKEEERRQVALMEERKRQKQKEEEGRLIEEKKRSDLKISRGESKENDLMSERQQKDERFQLETWEKEILRKDTEEREKLRRQEEERRRDSERHEEENQSLEKRICLDLEKAQSDEDRRFGAAEQKDKEEPEAGAGGAHLISFNAEDWSKTSESARSPSSNLSTPIENIIDVVYDDFSVKQPDTDVEFDDFSVKPRRRAPQTRVEATSYSWAADPGDQKDALVWADHETQVDQRQHVQEQVEREQAISPVLKSPEKDEVEVLMDVDMKEVEEEEEEEVEEVGEMEEEKLVFVEESEEDVEMKSDEDAEEDSEETQVNTYFTSDEEKLTDALSEEESHPPNDICEKTSGTDSPQLVPDVPSDGVDATESHKEADFPAFPEISTPLLDTSSQRSKAQLSRRRTRSRPSRSFRAVSGQTDGLDWSVNPPTGEEKTQKESASEEKQPKPINSTPSAQKVSVFPGLSPAALLAEIKKKTCGGGPAVEEDKGTEEEENPSGEVAPSPSQLLQSPRLYSFAGATRVLPPIGSKDGGAVSSPAWLKELKSKQRMTQHGGKT
ncbi:trichohyalin [Nematolebias whitei]|uniref:trichohyalin n=1 Tax=Nematolebias whitei TaxID=451745 RepID=UPI00189C128E|nr:trichohyalin [Nematolebias whitei]